MEKGKLIMIILINTVSTVVLILIIALFIYGKVEAAISLAKIAGSVYMIVGLMVLIYFISLVFLNEISQ